MRARRVALIIITCGLAVLFFAVLVHCSLHMFRETLGPLCVLLQLIGIFSGSSFLFRMRPSRAVFLYVSPDSGLVCLFDTR
jgi:hypothetical protein